VTREGGTKKGGGQLGALKELASNKREGESAEKTRSKTSNLFVRKPQTSVVPQTAVAHDRKTHNPEVRILKQNLPHI